MKEKESNSNLISPYAGELIDLMVSEEERQELLERSSRLPKVRK